MNLDGFGAFIAMVFVVYCIVTSLVYHSIVFLDAAKLIKTSQTKHVVKTFEPNTFRVYSSVRTIRVK